MQEPVERSGEQVERMQGPAERVQGPVVAGIDAIAVVGLCAHERRRYAMDLAKARGYVFVPAEQTEQGIDAIDRLVGLLGMTAGVRGFVLEYADGSACPEVIGALSAADSPAVLSDLVCVIDLTCLSGDLEEEDRCVRLVGQVEFASTLALLGPVGGEAPARDFAEAPARDFAETPANDFAEAVDLIAHLAPEAHRFVLDSGVVHEPVCWDFTRRPPSAGWTALLNSEYPTPAYPAAAPASGPQPGDTRPGIDGSGAGRLGTAHSGRTSGFRYEQARPFHPQRLQAVLTAAFGDSCWGRIIRSAGFARLASRPYVTAHWDQTATRLMLAPLTAGPYLGEGAELLALGQELAFIGLDLDEAGLREALERAVLTDAELLAGPMAWLEYPDDFPAWDSAHRG